MAYTRKYPDKYYENGNISKILLNGKLAYKLVPWENLPTDADYERWDMVMGEVRANLLSALDNQVKSN